MPDEFKVYEQYLRGRHSDRCHCKDDGEQDNRNTDEIAAWALGASDREKTYADDAPHIPLRTRVEVIHEVRRLLGIP